jgi:transcriptional regulator with GAF, ATPase, and Fis domain
MSDLNSVGVCQQSELRFVGEAPAIKAALTLVGRVAPTRATVLVTGETGTGKELIARMLHAQSDRADRQLLTVSCGAITESLLESELFGHSRGAFTGANIRRPGKFETAHRGTLFFDEVASMSGRMQAALLRVLQSGEYCPVGKEQPAVCDVRVIAAANKDLRDLVSAGVFRADLYYRLNIIRIHLPPLRERRSDLPALLGYFTRLFAERYNRDEVRLDAASVRRLLAYEFPGNVRELETIIHRATLLCDGPLISVDGLLESTSQATATLTSVSRPLAAFHWAKAQLIERFERDYLISALHKTHGVVTEAARASGLSERNFHLKLRKYGLNRRSQTAQEPPG